jgi:AcrR family transcriptional regulator
MTTALRADAQRNLVRVLDAAREVFAEHGIDAPVVEIAERAGVGVGTIFRRFPTKDDLVVAVVEQRTRQLIEAADAAIADLDPETALRTFMETAAAMQISDRCFCDASGTELFARAGVRDLVDLLVAKIETLLARAQAAGHVRDDLEALDLPVLLIGVAKAGLLLEAAVPGAWKRHLAIVFDGMRPDAARPLPRPPLTAGEFEAARASSHA